MSAQETTAPAMSASQPDDDMIAMPGEVLDGAHATRSMPGRGTCRPRSGTAGMNGAISVTTGITTC